MSTTHFLQLGGGMPRNPPKWAGPARRKLMLIMAAFTVMLGGSLLMASHSHHFVPPQQPGPRKFPPAYWAGGHWQP
jgi:hypothetical protein